MYLGDVHNNVHSTVMASHWKSELCSYCEIQKWKIMIKFTNGWVHKEIEECDTMIQR